MGLMDWARGMFGGKTRASDAESLGWMSPYLSSTSATGIAVNQQTAMMASGVMACVRILAEDVSKMTPNIWRKAPDGRLIEATDHPLHALLWRPNDWQTWPEFCQQMTFGLALRGNAYAVILRDGRGRPVILVPVNPDMVALWETPTGELFWRITRVGLHLTAMLAKQPVMIPYEDVFHLKSLSSNGLLGISPIAMAREAIALSLAQEQQYVRLMGNGARPSGILTTDQKLSADAATRLRNDWAKLQGGLLNSGRTAILEQGLKWQPLTLSHADMQFLQARQFQLQEIARLFRVPLHMIGDLSKGTFSNVTQQAQEYRNNTLTSHSELWEKRLDFTFGLRADGLFVDFDESSLLKADITARYNAYRIGRLSGWLTTNEIRIAEGLPPVDGGDELMQPLNMGPVGSDMTGTAPDGAGKPSDGVDNAPDESIA